MAIRYGPSLIVNNAHQSVASNLIIGERMFPHIFVRAASLQPIELHDMLPADTRFKILVFAGNMADVADRARLEALGEELDMPESFLRRYGRREGGKWQVFDLVCFSTATKDEVGFFGESKPVFESVQSHIRSNTCSMLQTSLSSSAGIGPSKSTPLPISNESLTLQCTGLYLTTRTCTGGLVVADTRSSVSTSTLARSWSCVRTATSGPWRLWKMLPFSTHISRLSCYRFALSVRAISRDRPGRRADLTRGEVVGRTFDRYVPTLGICLLPVLDFSLIRHLLDEYLPRSKSNFGPTN